MTLMTTFLGGRGKGETQNRRRKRKRKPVGRREKRKPVGRREKRNPVGVPADLKSADKKGSTYFFADLKSASSEVAFLPPVLLADYKSAIVTHTAADCKSAETEGDRREKREKREKTRARKPGHFCRLRLPACCPSQIPRASAGEARHLPPSARFCPTWSPLPHWYPHISSALQAD